MTSTEQLVFVSSLVGRVLVTNSMPGSISHAHFVAAMVADYVKKKDISLGPVLRDFNTHKPDPACRTSTAHPEGSRNARVHNCQAQEQRYWSTKAEESNQACVQYRTRCRRCPRRGSNLRASVQRR